MKDSNQRPPKSKRLIISTGMSATIASSLTLLNFMPFAENKFARQYYINTIAQLALGLPLTYCGYPHYRAFYAELKSLLKFLRKKTKGFHLGMATLVSLSTLSAYLNNLVISFSNDNGTDYLAWSAPFWALLTIELSNILKDMQSKKLAEEYTNRKKELEALLPKKAVLNTENKEIKINASTISPGQILIIKPYASIPTDGILISSTKKKVILNAHSMLNGESQITATNGMLLYAGMQNLSSDDILIHSTTSQADSMLATLLRDTSIRLTSSSMVSSLLKKVEHYITLVVLASAATSLFAWQSSKGWAGSIKITLDLLFSICPCSLGIARTTPFSILQQHGHARNIAIYDPRKLQMLKDCSVVIFDKTGTLTELQAKEFKFYGNLTKNDKDIIKKTVKTAEQYRLAQSNGQDLYARCITALLSDVDITNSQEFKNIEYKGDHIELQFDKQTYIIGSRQYVPKNAGISDANLATQSVFVMRKANNSNSYKLVASLAFNEAIKSDAKKLVDILLSHGKDIYLLTGDTQARAEAVAKTLGITHYLHTQSHIDKENFIYNNFSGKKVTFIGDGLNDVPAARAADASIAICSNQLFAPGFAIAVRELNDILLLEPYCQQTNRVQIAASTWSLGYIALAMLLSTIILPSIDIEIPSVAFAVNMAFSSLMTLLISSILKPTLAKTKPLEPLVSAPSDSQSVYKPLLGSKIKGIGYNSIHELDTLPHQSPAKTVHQTITISAQPALTKRQLRFEVAGAYCRECPKTCQTAIEGKYKAEVSGYEISQNQENNHWMLSLFAAENITPEAIIEFIDNQIGFELKSLNNSPDTQPMP